MSEELRDALAHFSKRHGLTVAAHRTGLNEATIRKLVRGARKGKHATWHKVAEGLGVDGLKNFGGAATPTAHEKQAAPRTKSTSPRALGAMLEEIDRALSAPALRTRDVIALLKEKACVVRALERESKAIPMAWTERRMVELDVDISVALLPFPNVAAEAADVIQFAFQAHYEKAFKHGPEAPGTDVYDVWRAILASTNRILGDAIADPDRTKALGVKRMAVVAIARIDTQRRAATGLDELIDEVLFWCDARKCPGARSAVEAAVQESHAA